MDVSKKSQTEMAASAEALAPFFSVDVTLKIFGRVIWEWHYPPTKN